MAHVIVAPTGAWHMCICHIGIVVLCGSAVGGCAHLRPTESWPVLVERLAPGKPVSVTTGSGEEVAGRVSDVSSDSMRVTVNGTLHQFARGDVRQVRRNGDSLWNGLLIGAAIGATAAAFPDPRYYNCGGSALCKDKQIPERLTFFAGVTLTGILIDLFHRDQSILYRSPVTTVRKSSTMSGR